MKLILNELSIPEALTQLEDFVEEILQVTLLFSKNKFDSGQLKMHIHSSFLDSDFGNKFYDHIYTNYDVDDFSLFNSLIDCPPTESLIAECELTRKPLDKVTVSFNSQEIDGIGLKASTYNSRVSVLFSFDSDLYWRNTILKTKAYTGPERFNHNDLINFSRRDLFSNGYQVLISQHLSNQGWRPSVNKFPYAKQASECYKAESKIEIAKCKDSQEKIPVYQLFGGLFAIMNGYTFRENLSKINSDDEKIRDIYGAGNSSHARYISIDVENGGFEFCDHDGTHLGTFGWLGDEISSAKVNTHSIKLNKQK